MRPYDLESLAKRARPRIRLQERDVVFGVAVREGRWAATFMGRAEHVNEEAEGALRCVVSYGPERCQEYGRMRSGVAFGDTSGTVLGHFEERTFGWPSTPFAYPVGEDLLLVRNGEIVRSDPGYVPWPGIALATLGALFGVPGLVGLFLRKPVPRVLTARGLTQCRECHRSYPQGLVFCPGCGARNDAGVPEVEQAREQRAE